MLNAYKTEEIAKKITMKKKLTFKNEAVRIKNNIML